MDLKRRLRHRTFALTVVIAGLIVLGTGVVLGRSGGSAPAWAAAISAVGLSVLAVGFLALRAQDRDGRRAAPTGLDADTYASVNAEQP